MDSTLHLLEDDARIGALLRSARRIAVLGIKTEKQSGQPAYYVPDYLKRAGLELIPVPVYYPEAREILGFKVYRTLAEIPGGIDIVDVFRRPDDIPPHLPDIIASKPRAVWFQQGIRHDAAARQLAEAGIDVIQDRCIMVDHRRLAR